MIVVFDAHCLLCSGWVRFVLPHDRTGTVRFAAMHGAIGGQLLKDAGLDANDLRTLLLVDNQGRFFQHTAAILRVLHALGWPWRVAWVGWLVPHPVRDAAYRWVAARRYRLFGQSQECLVPDPGHAARFLD